MYQIMDEVEEMMFKRNIRELTQIHKFIRDQRNKETKTIEFVNGSEIELVKSEGNVRGVGSKRIEWLDLDEE